jgi:hypothetical protein
MEALEGSVGGFAWQAIPMDEAAGVEQRVEQAERPIVLQADSVHTLLDGLGKTGQLASAEGADEQLGSECRGRAHWPPPSE